MKAENLMYKEDTMDTVIERKCTECKEKIEITYDDIRDVIYYKRLYYHDSCFCAAAEKKINGKSRKKAEWQDALDTIEEIRQYTKMYIKSNWPKEHVEVKPRKRVETDDLNEYLIATYGVQKVNTSFWIAVRELENGLYKKQKCKKVPLNILFEAWKWGQHKLNEIHKNNMMRNRGPKDNNARIFYDFSIIINKIPNYLAYKAKQDALMAEAAKAQTVHMNYGSVLRPDEIELVGLDDISDLLDDDDED
jgi:hypothetical protein